MIDRFYEHFVPVVYPAGHMGAFLINLLDNSAPGNVAKTSGQLYENLEWFITDILSNVYGSPEHVIYPILNIIKEIHPDIDDELFYIKILIQLQYHVYSPVFYRHGIENSEKVKEVVRDHNNPAYAIPYDKLYAACEYMKFHNLYDVIPYTVRKQNFKNKIYAYYPREKSWIPIILLLYKYVPNDRSLIYRLHNYSVYSAFEHLKYKVIDVNPSPLDLHINMYDLVINKDIQTVINIKPEFDFTAHKQRGLNQAHDATISILTHFGLDFEMDMSSVNTLEELLVLGNDKLSQLAVEFIEYKKQTQQHKNLISPYWK